MTKHSLLLAALVPFCLAVPATAQPTVTNGDFETDAAMFSTWPGYYGFHMPPAATGFPAGTNPNHITGWTHISGGGGLVPGTQPGNPDLTFRDNGANLTNVAFIQGTGSISQLISGFKPGTKYQLDFDYDARDCCGDFPNLTVSIRRPDGHGKTWSFLAPNVQPVDPRGTHVTPWYHGTLTFRANKRSVILEVSSQTVNGGDGTLGHNLSADASATRGAEERIGREVVNKGVRVQKNRIPGDEVGKGPALS